MWKYVSRRIRDVYDKTANVLEVRRTWNCGKAERFCADNSQEEQVGTDEAHGANGKRYCLLHAVRANQLGSGSQKEYGTGSNKQEGFKRKEYNHPHCEHSWLGAITWTSAIICGWYTSQLLCLHRRTQQVEHRSLLLRTASDQSRFSAVECAALLHFGLIPGASRSSQYYAPSHNAGPFQADKEQKIKAVQFGLLHESLDYTVNDRVDVQNFVFQINHDRKLTLVPDESPVPCDVSSVSEPPSPKVQKEAETVDGAFKDLISVLGEIEFQLGWRNLEMGEYSAAVSHLKLGASHQHAGAAFNLGICYEQGYGLPKDMRLAMECYQLAADQGHRQAMYNMGVFYARGLAGLRQSRSMAKKYFIAAANLGLQEAIAVLGPKYNRTRKDSTGSEEQSVREQKQSGANFRVDYSMHNVHQVYSKTYIEEQPNVQLHLVSARG